MRLSSLAAVLATFALALVLSLVAARTVAALVEDVSARAVETALVDQGHDWARVQSDGLQVILEGEAPSEAVRFRAMSIAGEVVDASRVIDAMRVAETAPLAVPEFAVEILRNDTGISLIGLIPAATDRARLSARISDAADGQEVADLLETGDYPVPPTWRPAMDFALTALRLFPQAKISLTAGRVEVTAIAESEQARRRLEGELARAAPEGIETGVEINTPRPVFTPFTARFQIGPDGARMATCAADDEAGQARIVEAAAAAGATEPVACPLGLGAPSSSWGEAVTTGIAALAELGGGSITFSDADVSLVAAEDTDPALFDRVAGELENALPEVFALTAVLPEPPEDRPEGPPEFTATLSGDGAQLRGRLPDERIAALVQSYAGARFGQEAVVMGTRVSGDLPQGWSVRVLAALEALSLLSTGSAVVTPDEVRIEGETGYADASAQISRLMIEKLGEDASFDVAVSYREALDPVVGLPTPDECIRRIGIVTENRRILFDPGSATLTEATQGVIDDLAEILRECMDLELEVAGYTDSQGSEGGNLRLSQSRADAVLTALRSRRVPVSTFVAEGYGEADPIADNQTAAGREANRRIEFRLVEPGAEAEDETGDDADGDAEAAAVEADAPDE